MRMKAFVMGTSLLAGLLAGCGGVEASTAEGGDTRDAYATPCETCRSSHYNCRVRATTPEQILACDNKLRFCLSAFGCEEPSLTEAIETRPPGAEGEASLIPPPPECSEVDGLACSTPRARLSCYWYELRQPGLCLCTAEGYWSCG